MVGDNQQLQITRSDYSCRNICVMRTGKRECCNNSIINHYLISLIVKISCFYDIEALGHYIQNAKN